MGEVYRWGYVYSPYSLGNLNGSRVADNWYWPIIGGLYYMAVGHSFSFSYILLIIYTSYYVYIDAVTIEVHNIIN